MEFKQTMTSPLAVIVLNKKRLSRAESISWVLDYAIMPLFQIGRLGAYEIPTMGYIGSGQVTRMSVNYIKEESHKGRNSLAVNLEEEHEANVLFAEEGSMFVFKRTGDVDPNREFRAIEDKTMEVFAKLGGLVMQSDSLSLTQGSPAVGSVAFQFRQMVTSTTPIEGL